MKSREEFERYFETTLRPELAIIEALRQKALRRFWIGLLIIVILLGGAGAAFAFFPSAGPWLLVLGIFAAFGVYGVLSGPRQEYRREFKNRLIRHLVEYVDPGLVYKPLEYLPQSVFCSSQIFHQTPDRYRGDDLVSGSIGQTAISFSAVHAEYKTVHHDNKGRRHETWHTIFKGLFFTGDFNKSLKGRTFVLPDTAERWLGSLGTWLQSVNPAQTGQLVKLEDPEFEKLFAVYSDDQVEARYVLSTSLMKRIVDFKKKTGRTIFLSFIRERISVAISYERDLFEPKLFSAIRDSKSIEDYLSDLETAVGIVEDLNLNLRIWGKQ